jgi:hypothetical protein
MKCKDSNKRTDNTEHLTLNEILKMFDEKLEKFFKQEKSKDMNSGQMTTIRPSYLQSQYAPPRHFSGPREVRCHNCQEIGHIRTRCPYLRQYTERAYETDNTDRAKLNA